MTIVTPEHSEHLSILEGTDIGAAGPMRADGLVPLHIIRPGIGRGKGRHLYEARMLEENAYVFKGWKMFMDHQSPEAKRAAGGLPRSVQELGGIVKESWWDPNVPADAAKGHGQGAVVGLVRPTPLIRQLIETDPALVEASVSATATGVRPVNDARSGGKTAWLVEGFNPVGTVDWVSRAGAGGRVAELAEALEESMSDEDWGKELFESMDEDELHAFLRARRPELARELAEAFKGKSNKTPEGEEEDLRTALEVLTEALETDEGKELVEGLVAPQVEAIFKRVAGPKLAELVEAAIEEERELITASANATADRKWQLRDLRDSATKQITESALPDTFKRELYERYALVENEPTDALDVADDRDEKGEVTKTASDKLTEAVASDIKAKLAQHAELNPSAVRQQGRSAAATTQEGDDAGDEEPDKKKKTPPEGEEKKVVESTGSDETDFLFKKSGVEIDESLYAGVFE